MQSKAHREASKKYNAKAYERLTVDVKKGERDRLKAYASNQGLSLNSFVCSCVSYCVASGIDVSAVPALTDSLPDQTRPVSYTVLSRSEGYV